MLTFIMLGGVPMFSLTSHYSLWSITRAWFSDRNLTLHKPQKLLRRRKITEETTECTVGLYLVILLFSIKQKYLLLPAPFSLCEWERMGGAGGVSAPRHCSIFQEVRTNLVPQTLWRRISSIKEFSPYIKENTTLHHYKAQLVNVFILRIIRN
jgi:hypothetical protein